MRLVKLKWTFAINKKSLYSLYAIFPVLFYLANLYRMTGNSSLPYRLTIYVFGAIGCLKFLLTKKPNAAVLAFAIIYFISGIFNYLFIGNLSLSDILADVLFFGIAFLILKFPCKYSQGVVAFYVTFLVFLAFYISGSNTHLVLTSSGNYISVLLIIAASFYYIALQQSGRKMAIMDVIPALLCFFLAVWAKGRGGILSTGLLAVLMLLRFTRQIINRKAKRFILAFIFLFAVGVIILLFPGFSITKWFFSLGKWGNRGTDNSARAYLWGSYLSKTKESIFYVLFGAPLDQIAPIAAADGNCHSSFLQLHAYNGLFMLIVFFAFLFKSFAYYAKKQKWILFSVLLAFCLRAATDKFIFGQYGMPLMLFFVLRPYFEGERQQTPNTSFYCDQIRISDIFSI